MLWIHPLFWFLRASAVLAAELIADDAAAGALGRTAYARTLMTLAEELHSLTPAPVLVPGTYRHATELTRRIEMLIAKHDRLATRWTPARRAVHITAAIAAVGGCALAFGVRPVPAAASAPSTPLDAVADAAAVSEATDAAIAQPDLEPTPSDGGADVAASNAPPNDAAVQEATRESADLLTALNLQQQTSRVRQQDPDPAYAGTLALVERAITLRAELQASAMELQSIEQRVRIGALEEGQRAQSRLNAQTLQHRLDTVMILVEAEIDATQLEIADIEREIQLGRLGTEALVKRVRLNGRLRVLQSVL